MPILTIPSQVRVLITEGAQFVASISGGKDGHAMLEQLRAHIPADQLSVVHADLGRTEHPQTPRCVEEQAKGLPLTIVRHPTHDMLDHWEARRVKLAGQHKPHWSSAKNRYCTSDMKRNPIDKHLRQYDLVVSCEGIRAQESASRAKKPVFKTRDQITTRTRLAFTWNPILDFTLDDVWATLGTSAADLAVRQQQWNAGEYEAALHGWPTHPAYVMGNERVSCVLCILGSRNDLLNGARQNPETFRLMREQERLSGFTFRQDISLEEIGQIVGIA